MSGLVLYARPGGGHVHTSRECLLLGGPQFEYYKYTEITADEAVKRDLIPCACINKTFNSHHRLTSRNIKSLGKRLGWEL